MNEENPGVKYIDRVVATSLNRLVDDDTLSSQTVSQASASAVDEFALRYKMQIVEDRRYPDDRYRFLPHEKDTVRSLFGATERDRQDVEMNVLRGVLLDFVLTHHEAGLSGVVMFGSRIDPEKSPRPNSDLDITFVLDGHKEEYRLLRMNLSKLFFDHLKDRGCAPPFQISLVESFIILKHDFDDYLLGKLCFTPLWSWKSNGALFIGKDSEVINKRMIDIHSSPAYVSIRNSYLEWLYSTSSQH